MVLTPLDIEPSSTGRQLSDLSDLLNESSDSLEEWLSGRPARFHYHVFSIPKRNGRRRYISAPDDDLKSLRRKVYTELLRDEAIQTVATGFVPHRSILDNSLPHLNSRIVVKIDLKNFFGYITEDRVRKYWAADGWSNDAATVLTTICCFNGALPQGAPTSPALCNVVNRRLDEFLLRIARKSGARYTRYADDLTFSFRIDDGAAESKLGAMMADIRRRIGLEHYQVQWRKGIRILRPHQRQIVTGLVVNNNRTRIPRSTRNLIRSLQYKRELGILEEMDLRRLEGYESFARMVEPSGFGRRSQPDQMDLVPPKEGTSPLVPSVSEVTSTAAIYPEERTFSEDLLIAGKNVTVEQDRRVGREVRTNFHVYNFHDLDSEEALERLVSKMFNFQEQEFYYFRKESEPVHARLLDAVEDNILVIKERNYPFYERPKSQRTFIYIDPLVKRASEWEIDLSQKAPPYERITLSLTQSKIRELTIAESVAAHKKSDSNPLQLKPSFFGLGVDLLKLWKWFREKVGF